MQLYIPIRYTRPLSKGEYPTRHQAVSSLKDTGPLFPLSPATIRIRLIAINIRECFNLTIHGESLNLDRIADHIRMHELHLTRGCQLALRDHFTNTGTTIKHVQNECFTWRHLRSVLDRHRITLNSHIFCAVNKFEHISISRFQKLKTVCNGMLRAHNFYGVAAPGTDFLIRSISLTGHTVFADKPALGEVFT